MKLTHIILSAIGWACLGCAEAPIDAAALALETTGGTAPRSNVPLAQGAGKKGDISKNPDYARSERLNKVAQELAPQKQQMLLAMQQERFSAAITLIDKLEEQWRAADIVPLTYPIYRAEALIGLGKPQSAIELLKNLHPGIAAQSNNTIALALALTGQLTEKDAEAIGASFSDFFPGQTRAMSPKVRTGAGRMAMVRLARAVDAFSESDLVKAEREARAALEADPGQPIASWILADCLSSDRRHEEARPHWQAASRLSGPYGEEAKARARGGSKG